MEDKKTNVLLTGASGAVGQYVLQQLAKDERFAVTVFDLNNSKSQRFLKKFADTIQIVYGDIRHPQTFEQVTHNVDVTIHLAAIIPPLADKKPQLAQEVNSGGTKNLLAALEKNSPQSFFLYSSSISVYGDRVQTPHIKTEDPLTPSEHDYYARTKLEAESFIKASKLRWSIFRLTGIMGYRNHKISGLMFEMPLDTSLEIATPEDTSRAFVHAIDKQEELTGRIFNLGGGKQCRLSYKEFLSRAFKAYGLGELDFPDKAFAEKNFHCGFYMDGDKLDKIVNFRRDSIEDYFRILKKVMPPLHYWGAVLFRAPVKKFLLLQSLPYKGYKTQNTELLRRFFN